MQGPSDFSPNLAIVIVLLFIILLCYFFFSGNPLGLIMCHYELAALKNVAKLHSMLIWIKVRLRASTRKIKNIFFMLKFIKLSIHLIFRNIWQLVVMVLPIYCIIQFFSGNLTDCNVFIMSWWFFIQNIAEFECAIHFSSLLLICQISFDDFEVGMTFKNILRI